MISDNIKTLLNRALPLFERISFGDIIQSIQATLVGGTAGTAAILDQNGKVPLANMPASVFTYKGGWNAATNTPELADGVGTSGDTYRVTHAGAVDFGAGAISFVVGDKAVYNGTTWEKWDVQDDDVPVVTAPASVTPTFTGLGTVSGITCYTWRVGAYLHFEYTWINGTVTATEARASLRYNPGSGEVDVTTASTYPTLQIVGNGASSVSPGSDAGPTAGGTGNGSTIILAESSKTYITFGAQIDGVIFGLTKRNGDVFANSAVMSIRGAVRVQGW